MFKSLMLIALLALPTMASAQEAPSIRVAVPATLATLDPGMALGNAGFSVSHNAFDTLVKRNFLSNDEYTGKEFIPGLASNWERQDDLTMIFTLRDGVKFQNGEPLTADDVKFSIDRILDPDSLYVNARNHLSNIASIDVIDDKTVKVVTKIPDAAILDLMAYPGTSIVSKAYYEKVGFESFGQQPIGTGPYKIVSYTPDQALKFVAFADYWDGAPPAASLTFNIVPEVAARITALANGEVDIATSIPPDQIAAVDQLDGVSVESVLVNSHVLYYNTFAPFMNKKLRQAMNLAIDRELLGQALWMGMAKMLPSHQYAEWGPLYNADRPGFPYDPDKARKLIAESGYKGEEIVFHSHPVYYTNGLAEAEAIVEMWRKVGLNARVQVNERWDAVKTDDPTFGARNSSDWTILSDPAATIGWTWGIAAKWKDKAAFEALAVDARSALDPEKRRDLYQQMLDLFEDEAPGTVLFRVREAVGVSDKIDWHPFTNYIMDFRKEALSFR